MCSLDLDYERMDTCCGSTSGFNPSDIGARYIEVRWEGYSAVNAINCKYNRTTNCQIETNNGVLCRSTHVISGVIWGNRNPVTDHTCREVNVISHILKPSKQALRIGIGQIKFRSRDALKGQFGYTPNHSIKSIG